MDNNTAPHITWRLFHDPCAMDTAHLRGLILVNQGTSTD